MPCGCNKKKKARQPVKTAETRTPYGDMTYEDYRKRVLAKYRRVR